MSKLAEAIRRSQRTETTTMGFGAARPAPKPTMLVGLLSASAPADSGGADIVLVDARSSAPDVAKLKAAAGDAILGVLIGSADGSSVKDMHAAGFDFITFDAETTPAAALLDEDAGYVLTLPQQPEELFLRSLDSLSLDAIYVSATPSPLTVIRQIELGRAAMLARKPLLIGVPASISSEDLQCLRAAGVVAVLGQSASDVATLKEAVLSLPKRRSHGEDRPVVSLPRGGNSNHEEDDDDDE